MSAAAAGTGAPSPPESVRLPVRHRPSASACSSRPCSGPTSTSGSGSAPPSRSPSEHSRRHARRASQLSPSRTRRRSTSHLALRPTRSPPASAQLYRYQAWWMLGGTAALLLVAAALMLAAPLWITRRRKLRPLDARPMRRPWSHEVARARARSRASTPPPPLSGTRSTRRPAVSPSDTRAATRVALGGGLVVKQAADPPAFRAVVRHELAHIRNRDVGITYFTIAVWYAFLLVAVRPRSSSPCSTRAATRSRTSPARLAVLALLVYLTRNAVLRSREVYADLRASVPDGPRRRSAAGARRAAPTPAPSPGQPTAERAPRSRQPAGRARRHAAALPARRRSSPSRPGLTATIAFESVVHAASRASSATPSTCASWPALVLAPLAAGVVGVGDLAGGVRRPRGRAGEPASPWIDGLALAAGFAARARARARPDRRVTGDDALLASSSTAATAWLWAGVLVAGLVLIARAGSGRAPPGGSGRSAAGGRVLAQTAGLLVGGAAC